MIPSARAFLAGYDHFARTRGAVGIYDERRVAEALREAAELAGGRVTDEPAAILFAVTRRPRALQPAKPGWDYPVVYIANLARRSLGAELRLELRDVGLEILRLRIIRGDASFEEVRAFLAARLHPIG